MTISLEAVVRLIVFLLVAAGVFALLYYLIDYVGKELGDKAVPFVKFARVVLVVCGILVLIGILLSFTGLIPPVQFTK